MRCSQRISIIYYLQHRNINSNKVALLTKVKQENTKLKEELNELRKNYDYLDKFFKNIKNNSSQKLNSIEFASLMNVKDNELNDYRRIMHHSIIRIKAVFENTTDEFTYTFNENMKNYIEGKSLEEKYNYYIEKLIKYIEVYNILTISIKKRKK